MYEDEDELKDFSVLGVHVKMIKNYDWGWEDDNYAEFEVEESYVVLDGPVWAMEITKDGEEKTIYIREGTWCEKNDEGEFEPDWSLSWFYEDEENPANYLYFEQDGVEVATHNFLRMYLGV